MFVFAFYSKSAIIMHFLPFLKNNYYINFSKDLSFFVFNTYLVLYVQSIYQKIHNKFIILYLELYKII